MSNNSEFKNLLKLETSETTEANSYYFNRFGQPNHEVNVNDEY